MSFPLHNTTSPEKGWLESRIEKFKIYTVLCTYSPQESHLLLHSSILQHTTTSSSSMVALPYQKGRESPFLSFYWLGFPLFPLPPSPLPPSFFSHCYPTVMFLSSRSVALLLLVPWRQCHTFLALSLVAFSTNVQMAWIRHGRGGGRIGTMAGRQTTWSLSRKSKCEFSTVRRHNKVKYWPIQANVVCDNQCLSF